MTSFGPIRPIEPAAGTANVEPLSPAVKKTDDTFESVLKGFVDDVDHAQKTAETTLQDFAAGKVDNVHDVMISMGKAEVSFKLMMEVRNHLLDAYQEIMRMPV